MTVTGATRAEQPVPTTCRPPGRPRDERASSAITDAALRQLDALGYGQMTMESVASEAGVGRATIYRRYRDKADLVTAAIAGNGAVSTPARLSDDPRAELVASLRDFDERAESCLEVIGTLIGTREDPGALALHRQRVIGPRSAYKRSLLERAQELGELSEDADLDLALQMLTGSVLARWVAGQPSHDGWAERAVDTIWKGMGTPER